MATKHSLLAKRLLALSIGLSIAGTASISWPVMAAAANQQAALLNNEGVKALSANNFQLAIQKFEEALKVEPSYSYAKENLAVAYNNYALKLPPAEAIKYFHKAMALNPSNTTTAQNLDSVVQALGKNPHSFKDRAELGKAARRAGDFEGAIAEYQSALKIQNDAKLHIELGDLYRIRDRVDEAINEYKMATSGGLEPGDMALANVKLGQSYQAKKDIKNAITAFGEALKYKSDDRDVLEALKTGWEEALRENPAAPENHIGLGQALQYSGDFGQAKAEYMQALTFDRNNAIARKLLADLPRVQAQSEITKHINAGVDLQIHKNYDDALKEYTTALKADPNNANVWVNIGSVLQAKEDYDRALQAYNKALAIDPGNTAAKQGVKASTDARSSKQLTDLTASAAEQYKAGHYAEALQKYQQVLIQTPNDAGVHFNTAAALQQLKRIDEAIVEYKAAVRIDDKNDQYKEFLDKAMDQKADPIISNALAAHKKKDYTTAIELYQQAIALRPKRVELFYNLGGAYYSRQQYNEARAQYAKALELDPKGQADDLWFLGAIDEHNGKGYDAMASYKKYLSLSPNGTYAKAAKERFDILTKNPGDTVKIKGEEELARIKDASDSYQAAVKLQQDQRYDEAIPLYQKAMQLQPKESAYPYALSTLYLKKGDLEQSLSWADAALKLEPGNQVYAKQKTYVVEQKAEKMVNDAVAKQQAEDFSGAISLYQQASQLVPKNARVYSNLASALYAADDFNGAFNAYKKALELDPKGESADFYSAAAIDEHFKRGYDAMEKYKKFLLANPGDKLAPAAKDRIAALNKNPQDTKLLPTRAEAKNGQAAQDAYDQAVKLQQATRYDEAIPLYEKAVQLSPKEAAYVFALGSVYQAKNDLTTATKYYEQAVTLDPKNPDFKKYLLGAKDSQAGPIVDQASQKYQAGDFPGAIELYRKALTIVPNDPAIHVDLASALQASDDFTAARAEYQKGLDLDPKNLDLLYFLGALDEHFGYGQQALGRYRDYMTRSPKGKFIEYAKARVTVLAKNPTDLQKLQTRAERENFAQLSGMFDEAVKLQQASKFDEAEAKYAELLRKNPKDASFHYARGTNFQGKGDMDNAVIEYKQAVQLDPSNAEYKKILSAATEGAAATLIDQGVQKFTARDFAGAIELYKQALKIMPNNANLHTNLAIAYQSMDNFAAARDEYQKGFDMDTKGQVDNLYFMGPLEETMSQGKKALADYTKYLQYAPKGKYAQQANARYQVLYFNPNKLEKLQTSTEIAGIAAANDAYNTAVKLQQENKFDEAIAKYDEALKANPNSDSVWYSKGTAQQGKGENDKALQSYLRAEQLNPKEASYKSVIKQLKQAMAAPFLDEAYKKQTTKNEKGDFDIAGAITAYSNALKVDDDATTHMNLGTAYQGNKMLQKAIDEYLRALSMDAKQHDAHYYLGTAYEAVNKPHDAALEYRKYLAAQPTGQYANDAKERLKIVK